MKRLSSSDSLEEAGSRLIPIHSSLHAEEKGMYGRGFQSIMEGLEEDECGEDDLCSAAMGEKKRRLSVVQVKALEKTFEVENKLDPERKVRLAQDLGLQPRQVAVWFQNRRARWKTKQLERDFSRLKANFESLKLNYDALHLDKEALLLEVKELRSKLVGEESYSSGKQEEEELVASESENKASEETPVALLYRDGSMDSDSSAILNDESSPHQGISSSNSGFISQNHYQLMTMGFNSSSPFEYSESRALKGYYQNQFGSEEPSVSFFSDEQDPAFSWYSTEQWN